VVAGFVERQEVLEERRRVRSLVRQDVQQLDAQHQPGCDLCALGASALRVRGGKTAEGYDEGECFNRKKRNDEARFLALSLFPLTSTF